MEIELFSNLHFSPTYGRFTEKDYDFQTQHKIPHLYSGHKTISFFDHFCPVSAPLPLWVIPTEL